MLVMDGGSGVICVIKVFAIFKKYLKAFIGKTLTKEVFKT